MKQRVLGWVAFGLFSFGGTAVLAGCPIYPDNGDYRVCDSTGCYDCPTNYYSNSCDPWQCNQDYDCPNGYSCQNDSCVAGNDASTNPSGTCSVPADCPSGDNCGTDNICHPGDCSSSGCPGGYVCKLTDGAVACVPDNAKGDSSTFAGCTSDAACTSLGAGAKCLDGSCVAAANECSDATQCPNSEQCVAGVCTPSCSASNPCPTGYACDTGTGVCSNNPNPCGDSTSCGSGLTCVDQHCVTPCGSGGTCGAGLVCVDNGCIPDQRPTFVCNTEGVQDACATGSICLHHNCYISCSGDGGSCTGADQFNVCKNVSTSTGTYPVCGSSSDLGNECDPTQNKNCPSAQVCIDGFCR
jgi:hypothetical protein